MSNQGPSELPRTGDSSEVTAFQHRALHGRSLLPKQTVRVGYSTNAMADDQPPVEMRVHFEDFAAQLRSHRNQEHKKRMLEHRRHHLQKAVALSTRLQRVGSWVHDGLVEISGHADPSGFVRVHQHMEDLVDICFSQWNHDIQAMDPVNTSGLENYSQPNSFLSQLTPGSQAACLDFIQAMRGNPRFLIERFKVISPARLSALSTTPKFQDISATLLTSLSQNRGRSSQKKRIKSYSKGLEEYASSFERSNPLSFLIYNCFGPPDGMSPLEDTLRLSTWSSVCAGLIEESQHSFDALINQVLSGFSTIYGWRAKDRMELFLMDVLQRGAFLLEMIGDQTSPSKAHPTVPDTLNTDQARDFFDKAVRDLFAILCENDGGFPRGALEIGRAILGKVPSLQAQMDFRGHIFWGWFLENFLRITITYPENEKMLLQFHISDGARHHILNQLWHTAATRATEVYKSEPNGAVDMQIRYFIDNMIAQLTPNEACENPYTNAKLSSSPRNRVLEGGPQLSCLTLCAADIIHALEALHPQYVYSLHGSEGIDPFVRDSTSAFNSTYAYASNKFDKLKRELVFVTEPGYSSKNMHPCQEHWITLPIRENGSVEASQPPLRLESSTYQELLGSLRDLDLAQLAATRLLTDNTSLDSIIHALSYPDRASSLGPTLAQLFLARARIAQSSSDGLDALYWENAHKFLNRKYPLTTLVEDDSRVLRPLMQRSNQAGSACAAAIKSMEEHVSELEAAYSIQKSIVSAACRRLNRMKVKMWYAMDVTSSNAYEDARNVSHALNHMALSVGFHLDLNQNPSLDRGRPGSSTSTSSLFDQPRVDTITILKAPTKYGGPKKLADPQIESTRKWLDRNSVENFCKGEERIHRFCMEVKMATKKLVGETLSESPVLWSSELWAREKNIFDVHSTIPFSGHGSTRAPSIMSDAFSSTLIPHRPMLRTHDGGIRSLDADMAGLPIRKASFHSVGSSKINRELLGTELASSLASPGHSLTATSAGSISSIWSPLPSQSRSVTSASQSRPASVYNDFSGARLGDSANEKARFLDAMQQELTCLLLSDLGNPVWSCGSETDAWMEIARSNLAIDTRLKQRRFTSDLLSGHSVTEKREESKSRTAAPKGRSLSFDDLNFPQYKGESPNQLLQTTFVNPAEGSDEISNTGKLQDMLDKVSQQVDPGLKLQAVHDFKQLVLALVKSETEPSNVRLEQAKTHSLPRRNSIGPGSPTSSFGQERKATPPAIHAVSVDAENDIVERLKKVLLSLNPKTLFRDLQYIAAFVPSDTLNKTESGRAFLHLGLAALACKDEVCRSMVDLADKIVAKDSIKRMVSSDPAEQPIMKAREYWVLAAREGNSIAQRELASLYLAHPEVPPIVSLPLALSKDIFRTDMMWETRPGADTNTRALQLALHWMQLAADNGDEVAKLKLEERQNPSLFR